MKITEYLQCLLSVQKRIADLRDVATQVTIDDNGHQKPLKFPYPLVVQTAIDELQKAERYVGTAAARIASTLFEECETK